MEENAVSKIYLFMIVIHDDCFLPKEDGSQKC